MARVLLQAEFEVDDESDLAKVLDAVHGAIVDSSGDTPMFGLEVDGEHRDPDDPETGLFS